jgi:hypothetical protein
MTNAPYDWLDFPGLYPGQSPEGLGNRPRKLHPLTFSGSAYPCWKSRHDRSVDELALRTAIRKRCSNETAGLYVSALICAARHQMLLFHRLFFGFFLNHVDVPSQRIDERLERRRHRKMTRLIFQLVETFN